MDFETIFKSGIFYHSFSINLILWILKRVLSGLKLNFLEYKFDPMDFETISSRKHRQQKNV